MSDQSEALDLVVQFRRLDKLRRERALSEAETRRWKALRKAIREAMGAKDDSRREEDRVDVKLDAAFRTKDAFRQAYISNLSGGGVFVATEERIAPGTRIKLHLRLAIDRLEVEGEVVWTNSDGANHTMGKGCGVRFLNLTPEQRMVIDEAVTREMQKQLISQTALTEEMIEKILAKSLKT